MGSTYSSKVAIPEGFADLADARRWSEGLERAERAIDSLWLQRAIYALERALRAPMLESMLVFGSAELPGVELVAFLRAGDGEPVELGVMLVNLFKGEPSAAPAAAMAADLESLRAGLREVEQWTRDRPSMLRGAREMGPSTERSPLRLLPGMGWLQVAEALGAGEAAMAMERAQIAREARESAAGAGAKRV